MKNVGLLVIIVAVTFGYTQAPDTAWTKTYGGTGDDVGYSVLQTDDGGYIIVGSTESFGAGGKDAYIVRTDPDGNIIWTRCYGGPEDDELYDVKPTLDDAYIVAGYTKSFGNGGADIWLLEIDSLGDTLRTGSYGGSGDDIAYSVEATTDSCYIVTGYVPMGFERTVFLMKTDLLDGFFYWMQTYTEYPIESRGNVVLQTSDGGYVIAADCHDVTGYYSFWVEVIRTDSLGNTVWTASPSFCFNQGHIVQVADGYVVAGTTGPAISLYSEFCLSKIDANGDSLWDKIVYSHEDHWPVCRALQYTCDGGYIVTGFIDLSVSPWDADIILIKTDANGDSLWNTIFGGENDDYGHAVQQTSDDGFIIAGSTESYGAGGSDIFVIKTEPDVGIEEQPIVKPVERQVNLDATIFSGPLLLPEGKKCKVFDITGRVVEPSKIQPGIYFIEIDGVVTQKVVKVR